VITDQTSADDEQTSFVIIGLTWANARTAGERRVTTVSVKPLQRLLVDLAVGLRVADLAGQDNGIDKRGQRQAVQEISGVLSTIAEPGPF